MKNDEEEKSSFKHLEVYICKLVHKRLMGKTQILHTSQGMWHLSALIR